MKSREIGRTGLHVTPLGFGGAPLGNLFAPIAETDARGTVETAWSKGCRYFDTAPYYGFGLSEWAMCCASISGMISSSRPRSAG